LHPDIVIAGYQGFATRQIGKLSEARGEFLAGADIARQDEQVRRSGCQKIDKELYGLVPGFSDTIVEIGREGEAQVGRHN
jgi:hypothetical protein